jgi:hypothetical protein
MEIQNTNPIGIVRNIPELEEKLASLIGEWNEKVKSNSKSWLDKIRLNYKSNLSLATKFLIYSIDELVYVASNTILTGPDKKATVLDALDRVYAYVVAEALPIWLKPFAKQIEYYVIYTLASIVIDWMVQKYKEGSWNQKTGG